MKKIILIGVLSLPVLMSACADPAANKPKATTTNTATATNSSANSTAIAPTMRQAKGENVPISTESSKVDFTGSKVTGKHDGGFKQFTGAIDLVNNKAEESQVAIDIDMKSVFTDADGLTAHLQKEDFFAIEKFPKSSFVSTKIVADTAKGADNYTVTGDLEMRGVKKSITFPAKIAISPAEVTVNSEFSINRKDFGIAYAGKADDLIRDDVVLKLDMKAPRKK